MVASQDAAKVGENVYDAMMINMIPCYHSISWLWEEQGNTFIYIHIVYTGKGRQGIWEVAE
jgi:hypothetical protein